VSLLSFPPVILFVSRSRPYKPFVPGRPLGAIGKKYKEGNLVTRKGCPGLVDSNPGQLFFI
jgi:hypothetical protein